MASPARPRRQVNAYQLIALLLAFVLVSGVGGVLGAGLLIPLAAGASQVTDSSAQIFEELPDELEPGPLAELSRVYAKDGTTLLATFYQENRIVVPLDQVSEHMKNAVVAIEDRRFYEHGGIDTQGTLRAALNNASGGAKQGGSSLTQQYVKNVLIEQAVRDEDPIAAEAVKDDTIERKAREAKLAISLEKRMTKDEILQGYLNIAQFGVRVYGVETAAQHYFGKSASDLTIVEAATIAGVTNAPGKYDPVTNPAKSQERRDLVLKAMHDQGYITAQERDEAIALPVPATLNVVPVQVGCEAANGAAFFCDYVTKVIISNPSFGETEKDRKALLYRGGLDITTTLDPAMQAAAEENALAAVPTDDPSGIEDAIVSIEPGTGKILAMAQNRPYDAALEPEPGTTAQNYSADQAHGSSRGFSPGSTWKPFLLAEWLRSGHTLNETVSANKRAWNNTDFDWCGARVRNEPKPWSPSNSDGKNDQGNITVLRATYNSINTAYATMEAQLRLCDVKSTAEAIGFKPAVTADKENGVKMMPSMVIGTQESSPLQMAAAYATFASGGTYCDPIAITRIVDAEGNDLEVPSANCTAAIDPAVANTVTYALENVMTQGSGKKSQLDGRPSAGKTGTANLNTHTWFVGYTPQVSTAVWIGNAEKNVEMRSNGRGRFVINGVGKQWWFGSDLAAPTWRDYMNTVLAGTPAQPFPAPDPKMVGQVQAPPTPTTPPGDGETGNSGGNGNGGGNNGGGNGNGGGNNGGGNGNGGGQTGTTDEEQD
ncbi:penicillin-binding protein [Oerskovia turbata]|uniref:Penicillin-binding protein n=1 Tax=Oerskovia turbata TaxID=1713 RepID=A0A4Q1L170_9CELL|nr:transglycosylase domain-containing protein [Oerskovia turbata]RXR27040.1 penicillin-binding protein [Oerskovia turbata]RXR36392.1 penicillin-binding protein [Oerskovia turbata]TGJ95446.1 glycosyl transferase family 51 [Actinotalea fermentans ATCC 43279 = JCM 9966 = DSM 3133]